MLFNGVSAFSKDKYGKKSYCIYEAGGSGISNATKDYKDYAILSCDTTTTIINLTNDFQKDSGTIAITKSLGKSTSSTGDLSLIEGKTVFKAKGTSSYRTARVIEIGVTETLICGYFSRTFDGLVKVESLWYNNPFSIPGDSGAPIYYKASGNTPTLVGLISGGNEA